ncbi:MAG: phosphomethylpyrimidine synthase ThiC [Candidatus Omnitrophota bacterium]
MKTLIETAKSGKNSFLMRMISRDEKVDINILRKLIAEGKIVIPKNKNHILTKPCGIGQMMRVKINANIGTSPGCSSPTIELKKLNTAIEFGADTVMDLSVGANLVQTQKLILKKSCVPIGTVPIYQAALNAKKNRGSIVNMTNNDFLEVIAQQAKDGVDFFTIHAGITKKTLNTLKNYPRFIGIVSRGGAIIAKWIKENKKENPLFENFDKILKIAKQYDIVLSLGDGLRPGTILDATDKPQISELKLLGFLAKMAIKAGVQVMIEGPGHIPIDQIQKNIKLQKKFCQGIPFYVLGPLVTDIGMGYDHITAAIGSGIAAAYGADFICFVTPAEHLKLPDITDIKLGVIASRIAAHSGDLARGNQQAWKKDKLMSWARKKREWDKQIKMSLDPKKIRALRSNSQPAIKDVCTMCGEFCSMKLMDD